MASSKRATMQPPQAQKQRHSRPRHGDFVDPNLAALSAMDLERDMSPIARRSACDGGRGRDRTIGCGGVLAAKQSSRKPPSSKRRSAYSPSAQPFVAPPFESFYRGSEEQIEAAAAAAAAAAGFYPASTPQTGPHVMPVSPQHGGNISAANFRGPAEYVDEYGNAVMTPQGMIPQQQSRPSTHREYRQVLVADGSGDLGDLRPCPIQTALDSRGNIVLLHSPAVSASAVSGVNNPPPAPPQQLQHANSLPFYDANPQLPPGFRFATQNGIATLTTPRSITQPQQRFVQPNMMKEDRGKGVNVEGVVPTNVTGRMNRNEQVLTPHQLMMPTGQTNFIPPPGFATSAQVSTQPPTPAAVMSVAENVIQHAIQPIDERVVSVFGQPVALEEEAQAPLPILGIDMPREEPQFRVVRAPAAPIPPSVPQRFELDPIRIDSEARFRALPPEMQASVIRSMKGAPSPLVPADVLQKLMADAGLVQGGVSDGQLTPAQQQFLKSLEEQIQKKQLEKAVEVAEQFVKQQEEMQCRKGRDEKEEIINRRASETSAAVRREILTPAVTSSAAPAVTSSAAAGAASSVPATAPTCSASASIVEDVAVEGFERTLVKSFSLASTVVTRGKESGQTNGEESTAKTVQRDVRLYRLLKDPLMNEIADFLSETENSRMLELAESAGWEDDGEAPGLEFADVGKLKHPMINAIVRRAARMLGEDAEHVQADVIYRLRGEELRSLFDEEILRDASTCCIVFLNDVMDGGETAFSALGIAVSPKACSALAWKVSNNQGATEGPDPRVQTAELAVNDGVKICFPLVFKKGV